MEIAGILEQKIPPPQAEEFKEWLLAIGEEVANAATEGGLMTVGGDKDGNAELTVLHAMRDALRANA
jgi:hypothetical protein